MKITTKNLERLCENCEYSPEDIGLAILRALGYDTKKWCLSGAVAVTSKDGKKLLHYTRGADVD